MLRVAAVAARICDVYHGPPIDRERLISALLVHDLGNIVKCDYDRLPHMLEEEEPRVGVWRAVQGRHRARFGADERLATLTLAREVGVGEAVLALIGRMAFEHNEETAAGTNFEAKIAAYADQRVGPRGVFSLAERFAELRQRYGAVMQTAGSERLIEAAHRLEAQLTACCHVLPAAIDDVAVAPLLESLRSFPVQAAISVA